jgi:hypothetical protein
VAATARNDAAKAADYANKAQGYAGDALKSADDALRSAQAAQASAQAAAQSAQTAAQAATRASQSAVRASQSAMSAQHSANTAAGYALSAIQAAHQAYQDAIDAGKDTQAAINAANDARNNAIGKANKQIADDKAKFADAVNSACNTVPAGPDHDDCVSRATRLIADPKGESERNVAVCNQLKQYSEQVFNECLKGAYNPSLTYQINKAIGDAKQQAQDQHQSDEWWSIAGTIVAGAVVVGAGIFCAEVCTAPLVGALVGTEVGFLADAAGAGLELTIGSEFITGIASDSFLASRLGALTQVDFLSGVAVRNELANLDLGIVRQVVGSCVPGASLVRMAAAGLCLTAIRYIGELADKAFGFRASIPTLNPGINAAVARLPGYTDPVFKDEFVRALSGNGLHAEEALIKKVQDAGFDPKKITELFTERSPCPQTCTPLLQRELDSQAKIYYVVQYTGEDSPLERELLNELLRIKAYGG